MTKAPTVISSVRSLASTRGRRIDDRLGNLNRQGPNSHDSDFHRTSKPWNAYESRLRRS